MKKIIFPAAILLLAVAGFLIWSRVEYKEKYDGYYAARMSEYEQRVQQATDEAFEAGDLQVRVTIDEQRVEYSHLGEDISYKHTCNGQVIHSGDVIAASTEMLFETTITEDDAVPDTGSRWCTFVLPPYTNGDTISIRVDEKGGTRYEDAYAVFEITYLFEPVLEPITDSIGKPSIRYWDVVFS